MPYENDSVRIERKMVRTAAIPRRQIAMVANRVKMRTHDEAKQNMDYWLARPVSERLDAVIMLSAQLKKSSNQRMDKTAYRKRKFQ